jgi:hypothetical protein
MSTAEELEMKHQHAQEMLSIYSSVLSMPLNNIVTDMCTLITGREVCKRRARKLIKRGEQVTFSHYTVNRKPRYKWMSIKIPKITAKNSMFDFG